GRQRKRKTVRPRERVARAHPTDDLLRAGNDAADQPQHDDGGGRRGAERASEERRQEPQRHPARSEKAQREGKVEPPGRTPSYVEHLEQRKIEGMLQATAAQSGPRTDSRAGMRSGYSNS